jgi:hypothetical protein
MRVCTGAKVCFTHTAPVLNFGFRHKNRLTEIGLYMEVVVFLNTVA